jgi:hypothetical protein
MPDNYLTTSSTKGDTTLQDLVQAINNSNNVSPQHPLQAKKLHRQVFEHKQAYLEQSKLFQQGLTNAMATKEAQSTQQLAHFCKEQARDVQKLAQNLDKWQHVLQERQQQAQQWHPPPQQPPPPGALERPLPVP